MAFVNLIVIKTNKLQEQLQFYSALGIQFEYHKHGNGPLHYASVGNYPVLEIYPLPKGVVLADDTTRLGFAVEKLDLKLQYLKAVGGRIISDPKMCEWGYTALVQDMDGRKIELNETPTIISGQ